MAASDDLVQSLAGLALFADLREPDLEAIADPERERSFAAGERILRKGLSGAAFFVILDGEAAVEIEGLEPRMLRRGDFFGEVSTLLDCRPTADVVATTMLRCFVIPGDDLERLLLERPQVMLRLLRMEARRLQSAGEWQT